MSGRSTISEFVNRPTVFFLLFVLLVAFAKAHSASLDVVNHRAKECAHARPAGFTNELQAKGWENLNLTDEQCNALLAYLNASNLYGNVSKVDCMYPPEAGFAFICNSMNYTFRNETVGIEEERTAGILLFIVLPLLALGAGIAIIVLAARALHKKFVHRK